MKLHYNPFSHNSRRVVATIHQSKANVELVMVDVFKGAHKSPEYLRINPNGMVPTLEDNGFFLWESNAIMQYVADKAGDTTLWPRDAQARADVARWQFWQIAHWNNAAETLVVERMFKALIGDSSGPDASVVAKAEAQFNTYANVLNNHLEGRDFIAGKTVTLADFSIASSLTYAEPAQIPYKSFKRVAAWYERMNQLDAWKKSAPPPMPGR